MGSVAGFIRSLIDFLLIPLDIINLINYDNVNTLTKETKMKQQLEETLSDFLQKSIATIGRSGDFLIEEIPEAIYQLMLWHGLRSGMFFLAGIVLILALIYFDYRQWKWLTRPEADRSTNYWDTDDWNPDKWDTESTGIYFGFMAILHVVSVITFFVWINLEWLQILIAPKSWIIESASKLIS